MSTEPYTPSLEVVKVAYKRRKPGSAYIIGVPNSDPDAEFDRFLQKVRADAWGEGYRAGYEHGDPMGDTDFPPANPHLAKEANAPNRIQTNP